MNNRGKNINVNPMIVPISLIVGNVVVWLQCETLDMAVVNNMAAITPYSSELVGVPDTNSFTFKGKSLIFNRSFRRISRE